jgi:hypothetical protein
LVVWLAKRKRRKTLSNWHFLGCVGLVDVVVVVVDDDGVRTVVALKKIDVVVEMDFEGFGVVVMVGQ